MKTCTSQTCFPNSMETGTGKILIFLRNKLTMAIIIFYLTFLVSNKCNLFKISDLEENLWRKINNLSLASQ